MPELLAWDKQRVAVSIRARLSSRAMRDGVYAAHVRNLFQSAPG